MPGRISCFDEIVQGFDFNVKYPIFVRLTALPFCGLAFAPFADAGCGRRKNPATMKIPKSNSQERLDRAITGGTFSQLSALAVLIILVLAGLLTIAYALHRGVFAEYATDKDNVASVIYYFFTASAKDYNGKPDIYLFAVVIDLLRAFVINGLFITICMNIVRNRAGKIRRGRVIYDNISDHYVLIGYSRQAISIIDDIFLRRAADYKSPASRRRRRRIVARLPRIEILTGCPVESVREQISSHLPDYVEKRILVYSGDIESEEHVRNLNINRAREVFVLGDSRDVGRDSKNLACVKMLSRLRGPERHHATPLRVNLLFNSLLSYSNIQKIDIPAHYVTFDGDETPNIYVHPFNICENWSRLLWSYYAGEDTIPLDAVDATPLSSGGGEVRYRRIGADEESMRYRVHLIIIGFDRMGRALLLEALRICHYINFDASDPEGTATRITVVDPEVERRRTAFEAQYPRVGSEIGDIRLEFVKGRAEDVHVREIIDAAARDGRTLLTVAVTMSDPDVSLAIGLSLPESVYYLHDRVVGEDRNTIKSNTMRTTVLIRQEIEYGLGEVLESAQGRFRNVRIFGMPTKGVSLHLLSDVLPMFVNANYELLQKGSESFYEKYPDGEGIEISDGIKRDWYGLSENMRYANRYLVDMIDMYLDLLVARGINDSMQAKTMDPQLLERLAETEHRRWVAERIVSGWRQVREGERRLNPFYLHDNISPYDRLSEEDREKDRNMVRNVFILDKIARRFGHRRAVKKQNK